MQKILNQLNNENKYLGFYSHIQEKDFYLENICKFSSDYIVILNNKKQIILCSENFVELFENKSVIDENFIKLMNKISDFPEDFFLENQYFIKINHNNKEKIFHANICQNQTSFIDEKRYVVIFQDITKENKNELKQNAFINTIKHDLKTPLRANALALNILFEKYGKNCSQKQKNIIKELINSNNLIFYMLDTLLLKFKYENDFNLSKDFVNLNKLRIEITDEFHSLFKEKNVSLYFNFSKENITLYADKSNLKIALFNIISNSIKFNRENGFVKISVSTENNNAIIEIKNTGIGISEDKIDYIFEQYTNNATCYRKLGTGLSLFISKKIIEAHKGFIQAVSVPNTETSFRIFIPI